MFCTTYVRLKYLVVNELIVFSYSAFITGTYTANDRFESSVCKM